MASFSQREVCPHCDCLLSKKACEVHRRLYYDEDSCQWIKKRNLQHSQPNCEFDEPSIEEFAFHDQSTSNPTGSTVEFPPPIPDFEGSSVVMEEAQHDFCDVIPGDSAGGTATPMDVSDDEIEVWNTDSEEENVSEEPPEVFVPVQASEDIRSLALIRWLTIFLLAFQSLYHLTDNALDVLTRFLKAFFLVLGSLFTTCAVIGRRFPSTLYRARKILGGRDHFERYVVCKSCFSVCSLSDCLEVRGSQKHPKRCSYIPFGRKTRCNSILLKTVELASRKRVFYPILTYCYVDLCTSFQMLLNHDDFLQECQKWKSRNVSNGSMMDIYDGKVWKNFKNEHAFFNDDYSFGLMLNCDWFQPYKHLTYSVGAVYLTVLNLPSSLRNKIKHVCLVGILPGPSEPPHDINSFITPLVKDLKKFWTGVELNVQPNLKRSVRCAIICVSCDIPAGRKLCGFLGHSARMGCSKCSKKFPGQVGSMDYSGFNRERWNLRSANQHREDVKKILETSTITARKKAESELGCRYSTLLDLPYFDPPVMLAIDPMHNLFLGIAKHHLKRIWISTGILNDADFITIQERIDKFLVPPDIGRIPTKIRSGFSSFTAEQFKNWVLHFSIVVLHDLLCSEDLECWRHFVLACRILCMKSITTVQLKLADALLLQYCKRTERMYGRDTITPNMHFCCHVCSCVEDFGPIHNFWLFSFERFNGLLGKLPNNNRSIEVQMMKRFQTDIQATSLSTPSDYQDELQPLLPHSSVKDAVITTLPISIGNNPSLSKISSYWSFEAIKSYLHLPTSYSIGNFSSISLQQLKRLYSIIYGCSVSSITICSSFHKYFTVRIGNSSLGSHRSRSSTSSIVIAEWNPNFFGTGSLGSTTTESSELKPVRINYFVKHAVSIGSFETNHFLAFVNWFMEHPKQLTCGKPVSIWEHELYSAENYIPLQLLRFRTVSIVDKLSDSDGNVLFVSPLIDNLFKALM